MRVLVVATPRGEVPLERLTAMLGGAIDWHDRYRDSFEAFGTFVGGGGFAVVNAADEGALNQMMLEMPFTPYSTVEIRPCVAGTAGLQQAKEAFSAMAALPS
jgi:hypothetical protein